ncbi:translation initiation factor IF-3 [Candidatus Uhrbacteria bacterium]|nr:translation initiation factor IF-3 [Candidatus Uhrbacteria bacterium]
MRIHRHRRFQREVERERQLFRVNERIRVPEVQVIDEQGENLGALPTAQALATARERGFDLIEVNPKAQPPICKFLDYKQFKYEQEKARRLQKAHAKKVEVKGVRLSLRIGEHDRNLRLEKAKEFFDEGNRVAVEIILRGRERAHGAMARDVIQQFVNDLRADYQISLDQPLSVQGGRFSLVVGGRKQGTEGKKEAEAEEGEEELDSAENRT